MFKELKVKNKDEEKEYFKMLENSHELQKKIADDFAA